MTAPHHVIVGGSAAGVAAALAMRRNGFEGRITLVEAASEEPYERPPLSKSFTDLDAPRRILPPSTYVEEDIDLLLGMPVAALDVDRKVVRLPDGEGLGGADAVLVATGVNARRLGVPGEYLEHVLVLRGLADARALAARLDVGGPWVIVGGGFIGLEAAAVARGGRGIDVTVVEAMPVPLAGVLGPALAAHVQRMHEREGVRILGGRTVTEFVGEREVEKVVLDDGSVLDAATVLVGCGVEPNDELARDAGGVLQRRHRRGPSRSHECPPLDLGGRRRRHLRQSVHRASPAHRALGRRQSSRHSHRSQHGWGTGSQHRCAVLLVRSIRTSAPDVWPTPARRPVRRPTWRDHGAVRRILGPRWAGHRGGCDRLAEGVAGDQATDRGTSSRYGIGPDRPGRLIACARACRLIHEARS